MSSLQRINAPKAPAAVGPYVHAVKAGDFVYVSGCLPLVPETGLLVEGCVSCQSKQVFKNLQAVLEAAGANLAQVVKTTCFLTDLGDFAAFNQVYAEVFGETCPARSCIEVSKLPKDALVEVEAVAYVGK